MKTEGLVTRVFRNWPAKILSVAAALLLLVFHDITRLEERFLTIPLEVVLNEELMPAAPYPTEVRVRLRGDSEEVFRVAETDLRAYVELRTVTAEGDFRVPVRIERAVGTDSTIEIQVDPDSISLVLEEKLLKSVVVEPSTSGFLPAGYDLVQTIMTPSSVELEGPRSRVEPIESVTTEDIDLSTRREDFTERVRIARPDPLVQFPGGDIVEVRGIVEELVVLQTFEPIEILVTGLDQALRLGQDLPTGLIRVQVRQIDLESLDPGELQLRVDASRVREVGSIRLPVQPVVPPGYVVLRYEPTSVVLLIEEES